jgi:hypothetical protein
MPVTLISNSFQATIFSTSPSQHRLVVRGMVEAPTPGYKVKLVVANPQGINRHILLLRLDVTAPIGIEPDHVVHQTVSFEESLGSEVFTQVTIENPGQGAVTINVPPPRLPTVDAEQDTFSAVFVPPSHGVKGRLVVHGKVLVPTPGWKVRLTFATPQGFNPRILLLVLEATQPTGIEPQHVVEDDVSFVRVMDSPFYTSVSVLNSHGEGVSNIPIMSGAAPATSQSRMTTVT